MESANSGCRSLAATQAMKRIAKRARMATVRCEKAILEVLASGKAR
jgi:hypothetical protein